MSSNKKTIAVVGATGAQGGSVVNYLLKNGGFKVRGLTRKVDEPKAKALSAKGVEMVASDLNGSVDDISKAFQGAHGAFLVTQWGNGIDEVVVGKKLVDAAVKAGVRHIIWSTLPNAEKISNGKYTVPHFTEKAHVQEYIDSLQAKSKPFEFVTYVRPAFYLNNFPAVMAPKEQGDTLVFNLPDAGAVTGFDVNEMGGAVAAAFAKPAEFNNKTVDFWGQHADFHQYVATFEKVTGKKSQANIIPLEVYAKFPFPGAADLAEMFGFIRDFGYYGGAQNRDLGQQSTPGGLANFESFLLRSGWKGEAPKW